MYLVKEILDAGEIKYFFVNEHCSDMIKERGMAFKLELKQFIVGYNI